MNNKRKPNRFKPEKKQKKKSRLFFSDSGAGIDFCIKGIIMVAFLSIFSLASIYTYDFITQSDFFTIKEIKISGLQRVREQELIEFADLAGDKNIFHLNIYTIEKLIVTHPWIASVTVRRNLPNRLLISIVEQEPLAIVTVDTRTDLLLNNRGQPFKEYDPLTDQLKNLPIITGLDLKIAEKEHLFAGTLFTSIMDFLQTEECVNIKIISGNEQTGITIEADDIYNRLPEDNKKTIPITLGFDNFSKKLNKAKRISDYIDKNLPERTICAMDLFNIEKVFIKTKRIDTLHNNVEKGV